MNLRQFWKDAHSLPLKDYDLIINDFEPVSAWACKFQKRQSVSLSHQCSFVSPKTPKPAKWDYGNWFLKYYSPTTHHVGFHFERYDNFIHTPVIRSEIRNMTTSNEGHYTVYLPAYDDKTLVSYLNHSANVEWQVFSKRQKTAYQSGNVKVFPVNNEAFNKSLASCEGLLTGGGFEGPAEALFLQKKVMMIPMKGQFEQQCNALAASKMGVPVLHGIDEHFTAHIKKWVKEDERVWVDFPDETAEVIHNMIARYAKPGSILS